MKKMVALMALAFGFACIGQPQFANDSENPHDIPAYKLVSVSYEA
jgi:hypothetical protein